MLTVLIYQHVHGLKLFSVFNVGLVKSQSEAQANSVANPANYVTHKIGRLLFLNQTCFLCVSSTWRMLLLAGTRNNRLSSPLHEVP